MNLPIPLCAVTLAQARSSAYCITGALIGWEATREIPTQYIEKGARIGGQTGRYGAAIDDSSLSPWRFDQGGAFGENWIVNGPSPKSAMPSTPGYGWGGYIWCSCSWYDGQYYWATVGYVSFKRDFKSEIRHGKEVSTYILESGAPAYGWAYCIIQAARASQEDMNQFMKEYNPSWTGTTKPWGVQLYQKSSSDDDWLEERKTSEVSYADIYDPDEVFRHFLNFSRRMCVPENIQRTHNQSYNLMKADTAVDPYPWMKAIHTLLYTYEFSDPDMANALVGETTHYRLIDKSASVWDRLEHRKVDGQQAVLVPRGGPYGTYMFEWLVQHAWMDAANSIPQANQNSIQNVMAAFELLASIRSGNVAQIPDILYNEWVAWTTSAKAYVKGVSNAWLRWRYEKSTTEMDINEYVEFGLNIIDRYMQQITSSRTHGHATYHTESGSTYECNCSMTWSEKGLSGLSKFFHAIWKTGMEPNAYVLWDFVPFSFVVDWFSPVGDVLETYSSMQYRNEAYYQFSDIVFSIRYRTGPIKDMYADHYVRWVAERPPLVDESYWFDDGAATTSGTTKFKRVLDSGSLIAGAAIR